MNSAAAVPNRPIASGIEFYALLWLIKDHRIPRIGAGRGSRPIHQPVLEFDQSSPSRTIRGAYNLFLQ
jgi:hypothetical protein